MQEITCIFNGKGGDPGAGLVQIGRRLSEARDDRVHGGLSELARLQLHLDEPNERMLFYDILGRLRLSFVHVENTCIKANQTEA